MDRLLMAQTANGDRLIKRVVIVARLFYHTAMVLLAQINPMMEREVKEMGDLAALHSQQICGIVVPLKDR